MESYQSIVIAGAGSELGKTLLSRLVKEPVNIILLEQSVSVLEDLCAEFSSEQAHLSYYCVDWGNIEEIENTFYQIYNDYQFIDKVLSLLDVCFFQTDNTEPHYHEAFEMMNVNYLANLAIVSNTLPMMLEENHGSIIALGEREPSINQESFSTSYLSSKAALTTYWRSIQKACFGKKIQLTLVKFHDPAILTAKTYYGKNLYQPENQKPILEQVSSMLEAIIFQRHIERVSSIAMG